MVRTPFIALRLRGLTLMALAPLLALAGCGSDPAHAFDRPASEPEARNAILFVGDGMGIATVTATRVLSVGVGGDLVLDRMPFTALSRTATTDYITPDSAGTMTAMITGVNTNNGVISMAPSTERSDFNEDGDGAPLTTLVELAKAAGMRVGIVTTARVTHATPAAAYGHINERTRELELALQTLPTDATYNAALEGGLDLLMGGGRRSFLPREELDEEGTPGRRRDGRDLRAEFQAAGYHYIWDGTGFEALEPTDLPALALFSASHMAYEYDRALDPGREPSLAEMTAKAIELLSAGDERYLLIVESGRIDHAHHEGNAFRSLLDTEQFDVALGTALHAVDLAETLVVATADHSHAFVLGGYNLRPETELPYTVSDAPATYTGAPSGGEILNTVHSLSTSRGGIVEARDANGLPYPGLTYGNGPGYRDDRIDPREDVFLGHSGVAPAGPQDPNYLQEAAVPRADETHAGEEVALYAIGPGAQRLRGTVRNTFTFELMRSALKLPLGTGAAPGGPR